MIKVDQLALFGNIMETPKTEIDVCVSHEIERVRNGDSMKNVPNGDPLRVCEIIRANNGVSKKEKT